MAKRKTLKCPKCDRTFSMAGHLAWHMQSAHGRKKKKAAAKTSKRRSMKKERKKAKKAMRRGVSRKKHKVRLGRPKGSGGLKLKNMTLEELMQFIEAATTEARGRLASLKASLG